MRKRVAKKKKGPRYKNSVGGQISSYAFDEPSSEIPEVDGEVKIKYIMIDCPNRDELVSVTSNKIQSWDCNEDGIIISLVVICVCGKSHVLSISQ